MPRSWHPVRVPVSRVPQRYELAVDEPPGIRTRAVAAMVPDKELFDEYQAMTAVELGWRVPQWVAFTHLLAEAAGNPEGRLARLGRQVA